MAEVSVQANRVFSKVFSESYLAKVFDERVCHVKVIGRDGTTVEAFRSKVLSEVSLIARKVRFGKYKFTRYREILVSKGAGKNPRVLSVPTVRDRVTLRALCDLLVQVYPECIPQKPHSYIKRIKADIKSVGEGAAFARIDVMNYYPSIDRDILFRIMRKKIRKNEIINLIDNAVSTRTSVIEDGGVPQGLSISNVLANLYLYHMDIDFQRKYRYYRYVDDILIICGSLEHAQYAFEDISFRLQHQRSLKCHPLTESGKSGVSLLTSGVEYLGYNITASKVPVRKSSVRKFLQSIASLIAQFKGSDNNARLLWRLNLRIAGCRIDGVNYGWMFFFLQTEDISQIKRIDFFIRKVLIHYGKTHIIPSVKRMTKAYYELRYRYNQRSIFLDLTNTQ